MSKIIDLCEPKRPQPLVSCFVVPLENRKIEFFSNIIIKFIILI